MSFLESPIASALGLAASMQPPQTSGRLQRALFEAATQVDADPAAATIKQADLTAFLTDRLTRRNRSVIASIDRNPQDHAAANRATIVDSLIDLRAFARSRKLGNVVRHLDNVIRIAAETFGPRDQSGTLLLYPMATKAVGATERQPYFRKA